jgi:hypothetical protein
MRMLALLVLAGGCLSSATGSDNGRSRPGVMPMLSELPGDAQKRDAILDQSAQTPGPEMRKGQTKKEKKVETAAATAAAILGSAFSTTQNVTIGQTTLFDENEIVHPTQAQPPRGKGESAPATPGTGVQGGALVPWVKLTPTDAPAP